MSRVVTGRLGEAVVSEDPEETYRYVLFRRWDRSLNVLCWIMLNPSVAGADIDDPTIVRCSRRALLLGYSGICVLNLFALRATDPQELRGHPDPVGPENDDWLAGVSDVSAVVAAWGAHGGLHGRSAAVRGLLDGVPLLCLGTTAAGEPKHPLYVGYDVPLVRYEAA